MALEGTLRDFSFADILQLISLQRKTGVLTLKNENNVVTISFLDGRVVGASSLSQHEEDRLGLILLKRGELSEDGLERALRRQEETLQRLGRILIEDGVVKPESVRRAMEQQILQIIFRVFRWADGDYHFSQETDIDYDRDLMVPMAADSIIMEGARMTDEWPFVDQRIPDREAIYLKVDPGRKLEVTEDPSEIDDLTFSFTDSPEEPAAAPPTGDRVTEDQLAVYRLVNGQLSVNELILESPLIEFDTCKALADLKDRGLVRTASQEEIARQLRKEVEAEAPERVSWGVVPWLAIPFLVLLGFSLTVMPHNPLNGSFHLRDEVWDRHVLESLSWIRLQRLGESAETSYFLHGLFPEDVEELVAASPPAASDTVDPWGRAYRMVTRGHRMMLTGAGRHGQPVPALIVSRSLPWEGVGPDLGAAEGPGVILLE